MKRVLLFSALALISSCDRTRADQGTDANLQVDNAQFFREAMPVEQNGPKILNASLATRLSAGVIARAAGGDLEEPSLSVAMGMTGDKGYWVLRASSPSTSALRTPLFNATYSLSPTLAPGSYEIVFRAVDAEGRFGPPSVHPLLVQPRNMPSGRLVIGLSWDTDADLDLHVVLPSGRIIFKRQRTEYERPPPSAGPVPPGAPTDGGYLDHDSNANCVRDGAHAENVIWAEPPPKGHYLVRVDTFALCGAPSANWRINAVLDGVVIGTAKGTSTDIDQRFSHGGADGVLALELDVP